MRGSGLIELTELIFQLSLKSLVMLCFFITDIQFENEKKTDLIVNVSFDSPNNSIKIARAIAIKIARAMLRFGFFVDFCEGSQIFCE